MNETLKYLLSLFISIFAALGVGAVIILCTGNDPLAGYLALAQGALGSAAAIGNTLARSVTLMITGLAAAVGARAGIFNVGGEGQLYLGALAATLTGAVFVGLPVPIALTLAFLAAMIAGGAYAFVPGWLKVRYRVNEVITTVMLNSIAILLCSYLVNGPLKTTDKGIASGTNMIDPAYKFASLVPASSLTTAIVYCAVIALVVWYVMQHTTLGYEMKMTGENRRFARFGGIKSNSVTILAMVASGMLCGIAGMFEIYAGRGRFIDGMSKGLYFDGLMVAMIMRYHPAGIVFMSLFFGALKAGAGNMEFQTGIASELIMIIQAIIIFFMAAERGVMQRIQTARERR